MENNNLIQLIENGRQVGVSRIIECENTNIAYTYAIQKKAGNELHSILRRQVICLGK